MEVRFTNGCSVNRVWSDAGTELIAVFQYEQNAVAFAKTQAADETRPDGVFYVVSNHYNGKITVVRRPMPAADGAK